MGEVTTACPKCLSFDVSNCDTWSAISDETEDTTVLLECQCHDCGAAFWLPQSDQAEAD